MSFLDSKFYRVADFLSFIVFINLIWVASLFTIVLFLPCTFALFRASRAMIVDSDNRAIYPFVKTIKQYFWKANVYGLPFLMTAFSLFYYVVAFTSVNTTWSVYLLALTVTAIVLFTLFLAHFLPIASHVRPTALTSNVQRAFWLIFYKPLQSLLLIVTIAIVSFISLQFLLLFILATGGTLAYYSTRSVLKKLETLNDEHPETANTLHIQESS
ncbi:DUF624 domain-containing protein [Geomicrobium sp. JSM 1781026]|uniref:DUF624 domain-containing protein n=1 Tax=Geomicrobium sp. JSM 1781026 TaxID=3344580 RepID=UPI0035C04A49